MVIDPLKKFDPSLIDGTFDLDQKKVVGESLCGRYSVLEKGGEGSQIPQKIIKALASGKYNRIVRRASLSHATNGLNQNHVYIAHRLSELKSLQKENPTDQRVQKLVNELRDLQSDWGRVKVNLKAVTQEASRDKHLKKSQALENLVRVQEMIDKDFRQLSLDASDAAVILHLEKETLESASGLAGHGGLMKASVKVEGNDHHLILKPLDRVEHANYDLIKRQAATLGALLPRMYGVVSVKGQEYMVLQDLTKGKEPFKPIADIKLAGKVEGLENPVVDQGEMLATRGRKKGRLVDFVMAQGAKVAPDFMFVTGGHRRLRALDYAKSKENLLQALEGCSKEDLQDLEEQLEQLTNELKKSPFAFIGASVLLLKSKSGALKLVMIDPAHLGCKESVQEPGVYTPSPDQFARQKESNMRALQAIQAVVKAASTASDS